MFYALGSFKSCKTGSCLNYPIATFYCSLFYDKVDVSLTVSWQLKSWIKNKYEHKASKTSLLYQQHDNNQPYKNEEVS